MAAQILISHAFLHHIRNESVLIAAILSGHEWSKKTIAIYSDNSTVVDIINKGQSHCLDIMQFMWRLTLVSAQHQFIIRSSYIPGYKNSVADSLSRFLFHWFRQLAPASDPPPTPVPPFSATTFNWSDQNYHGYRYTTVFFKMSSKCWKNIDKLKWFHQDLYVNIFIIY